MIRLNEPFLRNYENRQTFNLLKEKKKGKKKPRIFYAVKLSDKVR